MNRKNLYFIFFIFMLPLLTLSCKEAPILESTITKTNKADLIERDTMIRLLADCYLVEGMVFTAPVDSNKKIMTHGLYENLFNEYSITQSEFETSIHYHFKNMEKTKIFMDEVKALIESKRDSVNKTL